MDRSCEIDVAARLPSGGVARDTIAVQQSRAFCWTVRAGFLARGVTYAVIGGLAVALAVDAGRTSTSPNQQGALALIAQAPLGRFVVGAVSVGLLAYALWKLGLGVIGVGPEGGGGRSLKDRLANLGAALVYVAFFAVSVQVLIGTAGANAGERGETAGVLGWPAGNWLVGIAGVGLAAISIFQCYEALCDKFADDNKLGEMTARQRRLFHVLGRIGLAARALVFVLVGYFLLRTAINFRASGIGLDGALAEVQNHPFGRWVLVLVAAGLEIFAAFSVFEARYQRL